MSELMNIEVRQRPVRWQLLAGVSAMTLLPVMAAPQSVMAREDEARPTVWIELGSQIERADGGQQRFAPAFTAMIDPNIFTSPVTIQRPPRYAIGGEGRISFEPEKSDWVFSAAVRYGRSNNTKASHQQTNPEPAETHIIVPLIGKYSEGTARPIGNRFADTTSRNDESHMTLDFQAGKDVGLGLFGEGSKSVFSAGVRFAQFASKSTAKIGADPDFAFSYKYLTHAPSPPIPVDVKIASQSWDLYSGKFDATRSFHGIGPSVAWDASAPLIGSPEVGEVALIWGVNGAVLFGRQKARVHHESRGDYHYLSFLSNLAITSSLYRHSHDRTSSRSVTIPNVGGFAGLSVRYRDAKLSLGYRIDAFFGAMDGGIDARKTYDRTFYGPFASISVGLGG